MQVVFDLHAVYGCDGREGFFEVFERVGEAGGVEVREDEGEFGGGCVGFGRLERLASLLVWWNCAGEAGRLPLLLGSSVVQRSGGRGCENWVLKFSDGNGEKQRMRR